MTALVRLRAGVAVLVIAFGVPVGAEPFDSGNIDAGGSYSYTFNVPGTYQYVCLPHELAGMIGVVVVEGGS